MASSTAQPTDAEVALDHLRWLQSVDRLLTQPVEWVRGAMRHVTADRCLALNFCEEAIREDEDRVIALSDEDVRHELLGW